jgi:chromosomal replication initiator protein
MLNTKYSFSNFIEGYSNKMARIAGETIAQNPGSTSFNPLFIHGSSGVGKTHLLNAIGMKVKELHPDKRVLYVSSHLFHIQYIDAIRSNNINDFIHFYQTIDVLIIDDMQELSGFPKTTNTFFHIFNHLHQNRKQLIMSCDRHPKDLKDIEERMITRFKWGLVTELEKPDLQLRKNILKDKTSRDGLVVNDEVIDYAAENIAGSVRDLEGFIASLMAHSTFYNKEINLELTKEILNKNSKKEEKPITIESIINTVCEYFDVDVDAIQTKSRKHEVVQVRQISMYLAKKHLDFSTSKIGAYIGKRDHATVLHACNMVKDQLQVDKNFRKDMENIESSLKS